ncbi:hypothetical protein BDV39DRAFT_186564 [Aspergillus sergii]|uniref:Uncharacterized protein n=1 Tax=Aspergillus sergii TaxID=1034303 RepID=A0A5N6WLC7_9EURO|nr:hypothetical protein BDV39DRAFT_186564 [Aspergillus sergii]
MLQLHRIHGSAIEANHHTTIPLGRHSLTFVSESLVRSHFVAKKQKNKKNKK